MPLPHDKVELVGIGAVTHIMIPPLLYHSGSSEQVVQGCIHPPSHFLAMASAGQRVLEVDSIAAQLAQLAGGSMSVALLQTSRHAGGPDLHSAAQAARAAAEAQAAALQAEDARWFWQEMEDYGYSNSGDER